MRSGCATTSGAATSPSRSSSSASCQAAGLRRMDRHARKVGRVFVLEVEAAGDAGCAAGGRVGAGALAEPPRKVLVLAARQREPCLKIAGRGFEGEKHGGGEGRELIGLEVVELDEATPGPCGRTMTLRCGRMASSSIAGRVRVRSAGDTLRRNRSLSPARVGPCHIEARGTDAGEGVEHRPRFAVSGSGAALSHAPPVFHYGIEATPVLPVRKAREAGTMMIARFCATASREGEGNLRIRVIGCYRGQRGSFGIV